MASTALLRLHTPAAVHRLRVAAALLVVIFAAAHLVWLPVSTQVGQLAVPWLMNAGLRLYDDLIENRPPLVAALVALTLRLPLEPITAVRLLHIVLLIVTALVIYRLATRLRAGDERAGLAALVVWCIWQPVYGNILFYFDTINGLLTAAAVLIGIGLLLGLTALVKQPGWAVIGAAGLWFIIYREFWAAFVYAISALLPSAAAAIFFALSGDLASYWYWTVTFNLSRNIQTGSLPTGGFLRKLLLTDLLVLPFAALTPRPAPRAHGLALLLWGAALVSLLPHFGEVYVTAHLPLTAALSGVVIAALWEAFPRIKPVEAQRILLGGALVIGIGVAYTAASAYVPGPLGPGRAPAYDEFLPLAQELRARRAPGDTLYVLPMLDGNPQLYPLTDMLPPGLWVNGHAQFLSVPDLVERLLREWAERPPTWIVD
ncbi:MAG: hypothetical protein NZM00_06660, partial [Anaerolinea sp.]|nr:hypothetical protein [Anaerolinea sp.]